jgi:hypothetical protein
MFEVNSKNLCQIVSVGRIVDLLKSGEYNATVRKSIEKIVSDTWEMAVSWEKLRLGAKIAREGKFSMGGNFFEGEKSEEGKNEII